MILAFQTAEIMQGFKKCFDLITWKMKIICFACEIKTYCWTEAFENSETKDFLMTVERFAICSCPVVVYKNHLLQ